jgi:uncharacterized membrane protein YgcG
VDARSKAAVLVLIAAMVLIPGCVSESKYDTNMEEPPGDPPFPPQKVYGIVDPQHVLSDETVRASMPVLQKLKEDGIAEVVILVQPGVKHPEDYATHYGRYIGLGMIGENNGIVWLIRPDVSPQESRMTYSIGRGLPDFTSSDAWEVMETAADAINFGNYDLGVKRIVQETDKKLR